MRAGACLGGYWLRTVHFFRTLFIFPCDSWLVIPISELWLKTGGILVSLHLPSEVILLIISLFSLYTPLSTLLPMLSSCVSFISTPFSFPYLLLSISLWDFPLSNSFLFLHFLIDCLIPCSTLFALFAFDSSWYFFSLKSFFHCFAFQTYLCFPCFLFHFPSFSSQCFSFSFIFVTVLFIFLLPILLTFYFRHSVFFKEICQSFSIYYINVYCILTHWVFINYCMAFLYFVIHFPSSLTLFFFLLFQTYHHLEILSTHNIFFFVLFWPFICSLFFIVIVSNQFVLAIGFIAKQIYHK